MIKVTVELWPFGMQEHKKLLAEMDIYNDATGDVHSGNYGVRTYRKGTKSVTRRGYVTGYKRKREHVWKLVRKALESVRY